MRRFACTWAVLGFLAAAAVPAPGAEKVAPEGLWKSSGEVPLMDLAGFPDGTFAVRMKFLCLRDGKPYQVQWIFSRGLDASALGPERMEMEPVRKPDPALFFPEALPAEDFMQGWRKFVKAAAAKDLEALRPYVPAKDRAEFGKGENDLAKILEALAEAGWPAEAFEKSGLPRVLSLPARCNAAELSYVLTARKGEQEGILVLQMKMHVEAETPANWVLDNIEPEFKNRPPQMPAFGKDAAAPDGLRKLLGAGLPLPDVAGLPAGVFEAVAGGICRLGGRFYESEARWAADGPGTPLRLVEAGFTQKKELDRGLAIPAAAPAEGPLESIRGFLTAAKTWDPEKVWSYFTAREKERNAKDKDKTLQKFKEKMERRAKEDGFNAVELLLANLPDRIAAPGEFAAIEVGFRFPGEAGGKKGSFEAGFKVLVEAPDAAHWSMKDFDADFREDK
jgi:hypothetical protein